MTTLFIRVQGPASRTATQSSVDEPLHDVFADGYNLSAQWLISEPNGSIRAEGQADLRGLSDLIDPESDWLGNPANVVLLIPAGLVLNINCEVPGRNASQVRRALPFAVEEFIATDIEAMHVSAGAISRGGMVRSQVVEREQLDDWLAALASIGIRPGYALSDAELLPADSGRSTLLFDGEEVLMRNADSAACIDAENLEFVLGQFIETSGDEAVIETVNGEIDPLSVSQLPPEVEFSATNLPLNQSVLAYLASLWPERGVLPGNSINLLQGEYTVRMNASGEQSRWRMVGMLAAGWFGIALLALGAKGFYSDHEADRLKGESEALYKDIYPSTQRIPPNMQREMQFRMGGSDAAQAAFVPLMGQLSAEITPEIKVRSFSFQASREELTTELVLSGFNELDTLKDNLAKGGLAVEISSADQQSDGVHARLRLRASNAG